MVEAEGYFGPVFFMICSGWIQVDEFNMLFTSGASGTPSQPLNGVLEGSFVESRLIQVDNLQPSDFT